MKEFMLKLPESLHRELKVYSVVHNTTMTEFIVKAIKDKLEKEA